VTGNHRTGTGSDVTGSALNRKSRVLGWETADQVEKGIVGSGNRKSHDLGGGNRGPVGKIDRGLRTAEKRGLKVQSPMGASGVVPGLQKKIKKNKKKTPC